MIRHRVGAYRYFPQKTGSIVGLYSICNVKVLIKQNIILYCQFNVKHWSRLICSYWAILLILMCIYTLPAIYIHVYTHRCTCIIYTYMVSRLTASGSLNAWFVESRVAHDIICSMPGHQALGFDLKDPVILDLKACLKHFCQFCTAETQSPNNVTDSPSHMHIICICTM